MKCKIVRKQNVNRFEASLTKIQKQESKHFVTLKRDCKKKARLGIRYLAHLLKIAHFKERP